MTVAFDIGGVLRQVHLPNTHAMRFDVMCALYRALWLSPNWRVVVVTRKPSGVAVAMTQAELEGLGLPKPDDLVVLHGEGKQAAYKRLGVDLVFDDEPRWVEAATKMGAVGALVQ